MYFTRHIGSGVTTPVPSAEHYSIQLSSGGTEEPGSCSPAAASRLTFGETFHLFPLCFTCSICLAYLDDDGVTHR